LAEQEIQAILEVLDATGIVPWMAARMKDDRRQADVIHDLPSLLRTMVLLAAQGWQDHDDADALRQAPLPSMLILISRAAFGTRNSRLSPSRRP